MRVFAGGDQLVNHGDQRYAAEKRQHGRPSAGRVSDCAGQVILCRLHQFRQGHIDHYAGRKAQAYGKKFFVGLFGKKSSAAANAGAKAEGLSAAQENITIGKEAQGTDTAEESQESQAAKTSAKANPAAAYSFDESDMLMWPVTGDIVLKYSMDTTIYFKTLGMYKCNPAVNIAAEAGTNVGVAADGVVESVTYSEETGNTVAVAIGNGYVTTYGLIDNVVVKKGDTVVAGQLLGTVSDPTAYYVEEGPNLYFMLTKDGEPADPAAYFED